MLDILVPHALLPGGWASDVRIAADARGVLTRVEAGTDGDGGIERVDGVALPGMANLHSHAFQRAMAGLAERRGGGAGAHSAGSVSGDPEDSFWSWRSAMYAFLERLGPDHVEAVATQLYVEMLRAGYTCVGEFHYLHHAPGGERYDDPAEMSRRLLSAARASGLGLALLPAVYMTGDFGGAPPADGQRRFLLGPDGLAELLGAVRGDFARAAAEGGGAARLGVALHSLRAVPPEAIAPALEALASVAPGAPVHVHAAEQRREVEACLAWSGARPVEWLLANAPVDARWCLVHATHLSDGEVAGLARSGAVAGLCPTTEANLGDGLFRLRDHLAAGGRIGIGSDSHVSVSLVEELRWLEYGQRLTTGARNVAAGFPHASTGRTLFEAAAVGGARALGLPAGALEVGRRADVVVLDPEHASLAGREGDALLDSWIFSSNRSAVRHVIVGGRWVVSDGHHPLQEEALERYREVVRELG